MNSGVKEPYGASDFNYAVVQTRFQDVRQCSSATSQFNATLLSIEPNLLEASMRESRESKPTLAPCDSKSKLDLDATFDTAGAAALPAADLPAIGRYRLRSKLGEGGMGQVWLAEQSAPIKRKVALKVIKTGRFDESALQRFALERQSLALMDHPTIAKVFDADSTDEGQPYFVMEYVPGLPITTYCDQKKLTTQERLQLFVKVCEGVQHAHQRAIIHRDLKPSNVLVGEVDGSPMPRIIDFGIAKAISAPSGDETLLTRVGGMVGSPGYISPEQADPSVQDVDTRTDVYSLGVILYELLTGCLPFDRTQWRTKPLDEVLRQLREDDPLRPSTKVGTEQQNLATAAANRKIHPEQFVHLLRGDLDWIALKAIEKDRNRRYGTPSELAIDISHYLNYEPVVARPASASYRLQKYARRHRVGVAVASSLVLLLAGFAIMQAIQVRRVTHERDRANQVTDFMTSMFKVSDPSETRGNSVTAREILDRASRNIDVGLWKDPELQAQMMVVMGNVYDNLGLYSRSQSLFERALSIQKSSLGSEHPDTLKSSSLLAQTLLHEGRANDAEKLARQASNGTLNVLGPRHPDTLISLGTLASILEERAEFAEAERLDREILRTAESVFGTDHIETVKYRNNLAGVMNDLARYSEAEALERHNLEIDQRILGPDHPITLNAMNSLAVILGDSGRLAEAETIERQMLTIQRRILGAEHLDTLRSSTNLANYMSDQGRYAEAEKLQRETLNIERRVLGSDHPETVRTMDNLANSLSELGRYTEAEKLEREALDLWRRVYGNNHPFTANAAYDLACILALQGRRDEALAYLRDSVDYGLPAKAVLGMEADSDLKSLHGDPSFDALVARAKEPSAAHQATK